MSMVAMRSFTSREGVATTRRIVKSMRSLAALLLVLACPSLVLAAERALEGLPGLDFSKLFE